MTCFGQFLYLGYIDSLLDPHVNVAGILVEGDQDALLHEKLVPAI